MDHSPIPSQTKDAEEVTACLCGSARPASEIINARDEESGEQFTYLVCHDCSLERLSPRPTLTKIGAYYPTHYVPHAGVSVAGRSDRFKRLIYEVFWANADEMRPALAPYRALVRAALWPFRYRSILAFSPPRTRRVFEFGAAKATDLLAFKAAGWQVEGCEPSSQACTLAGKQGIHLQEATAETAQLEDQAYSAILFNNVFEHIHDPPAVLQKCRRALMDNGLLILIVPNHASWTRRLFGAAWPGYDAPRHLWGWSPSSARRHLGAAGLDVEAVHHQATGPWLWRSTLDMRHSPHKPGPVRLWLSKRAAALGIPFSILAAATGHGDFIKIMARKVPPVSTL